MTGDCSTCKYSIGALCFEGPDGQAFLDSTDPGLCPYWEERDEKWKSDLARYTELRPWPFKT